MDETDGRDDWLTGSLASTRALRRDGSVRHQLPRVDTSSPFAPLPPMQLSSADGGLASALFAFPQPHSTGLARSGSASSDEMPVSPESAHVMSAYGNAAAIEARQSAKRQRTYSVSRDDEDESPPSIAPALLQSPGGESPSAPPAMDVSTYPLIDLSTSNNGGPFVHKLYNMALNPATQHLLSFSADGTSFTIHDPAALASEVLPVVFKHSNLSSFVRQLNMYAFGKARSTAIATSLTTQVNKLPRGQRQTEPNAPSEFSHPSFIRGRPDLLDGIRRKAVDAAASLEPSEKPKLRPNVRRSSEADSPMPPPSMTRRSSAQSVLPQPVPPNGEATRTAALRAVATAHAHTRPNGSLAIEQQLRQVQDACDHLYRMVIEQKQRGDQLAGVVFDMHRAMQAAGVPIDAAMPPHVFGDQFGPASPSIMISSPAQPQYATGPPAYMTPPTSMAPPMDRRSSIDPAAYTGMTALHVGTPAYSPSSAYSSPGSYQHSSPHSRHSSDASFHAPVAQRRPSNPFDTLQAAVNVPLPPSPLVIPSAPLMGLGFQPAPTHHYQPLSYSQSPYSDVRMGEGGQSQSPSS